MSFLQLVRRGMRGSLRKLVFMSAIGGISSAAILAAINAGAQAADQSHKPSLWAVALFLISLLLFIKTLIYVTTTVTAEIEAIIHRLRVRLMDDVRHSELLAIEKIGRSRIYAAITGDAGLLTQASNTLCFSMQSVVVVFFVAIYVAYLSLVAFLLSVVIVFAAGAIFHYRGRRVTAERARAAEQERRLFDRLTDFLDGFKEVRLNSARSGDLFDDAVDVSRTAANIKIGAQVETFRQIVSAQAYMYILLGAVVFVAPTFSESLAGGSITKTTTALLFVVGAAFGLVQSIPILSNANAAADRLLQLDSDLRATVTTEGDEIRIPRRFDKIEMRNIIFRYVDRFSEVVFQIGPIDFTLQSGELVFVTGGNGSGKSTFMRVLAGLYPPASGEIMLDGMPVTDDTRDAYRSLISTVFTDYHVFRRLYGIPEPAPSEIGGLLAQFRLADKTGLSHGEFRTLDLSDGQRKRLALVVSLLEKRPILLLDEWTADQDPEFRRRFYHELLPELVAAGATVVAVTHDERYLDELQIPARRIMMDEGHIAGVALIGPR
ncbi:MAG TPA: cyclic peptide export ABC transporter [Xanthobacteraceae bacterium]|nr:cyclic peptide export ABC transporter [Xanthobacteraceae bacterium]